MKINSNKTFRNINSEEWNDYEETISKKIIDIRKMEIKTLKSVKNIIYC